MTAVDLGKKEALTPDVWNGLNPAERDGRIFLLFSTFCFLDLSSYWLKTSVDTYSHWNEYKMKAVGRSRRWRQTCELVSTQLSEMVASSASLYSTWQSAQPSWPAAVQLIHSSWQADEFGSSCKAGLFQIFALLLKFVQMLLKTLLLCKFNHQVSCIYNVSIFLGCLRLWLDSVTKFLVVALRQQS